MGGTTDLDGEPSHVTSALPIFRSDAQAALLTELFVRADRPLSLTALSKQSGIPLSSLQREVNVLERSGIVRSERVGATRLVTPNRDSPYFHELSALLMKAFGPLTLLSSKLRRVDNIDHAFIFGSWARRYLGEADRPPADIDVLVVGDVDTDAVYAIASEAEPELGLEVNPVVVTPAEWHERRGLVRRIRNGPLVPLEV